MNGEYLVEKISKKYVLMRNRDARDDRAATGEFPFLLQAGDVVRREPLY